jgi:hypothetical protein
MTKACYVTAFIDLNRSQWDKWEQRGTDAYFTAFSRLIPLFANSTENELFVYIDTPLSERIRNICNGIPNIHIVPIDDTFLSCNSLLWRRLPKETSIMRSEQYRTLLKDRLDYPEHSVPKYNMINHAKIDLVVYTMNLTDAPVLGWIDFGYCKTDDIVPNTLLDISKLVSSKMNFSLVNHIEPHHYNIMQTLTNPPELIEGGFFFSDRDTLIKYQKFYHKIHEAFHTQNIVDDDQHIILQAYRHQPELFNLVYQGKWLMSLKYFELSKPEFVVYPAGGLGNQLFQIAHGYALSRQFDGTLLILDSSTHDYRRGNPTSKYRNTIFKPFRVIESVCTTKKPFLFREQQWAYYDTSKEIQSVLDSNKFDQILIQHGFFSSVKYFSKYSSELRGLLTPKQGVREWLRSQPENVFAQFPELDIDYDQGYCFMGIRRTDYLQYPEHNPCSLEYFKEAIRQLPAVRYYISSDDMDWCKQVFVGSEYRFFDIKDDLTQFYVGTLFSRYIISNSSFHWWISYMSTCANPIVIAPDKWIGGPDCKEKNYWSIYRNGMKVVKRLV